MDILRRTRTSMGRYPTAHTLLTVIGLCLMLSPYDSSAQISPGELSSYHSKLGGLSNCTKCHDAGGQSSDEKCLSCHEEIRIRISEKKGFHWKIVSEGGKDCSRCHTEHNGTDFELVYWESGMREFDHGETGFQLEGNHGESECRSCHQQKYVRGDLIEKYPDINPERTFLGLGTACIDCHRDTHRAQFADNCTTCHDLLSWRPASRFSHDRTKYPLSGKHREVGCEKCHPGGIDDTPVVSPETGSAFVKYSGLPHEECESCHHYQHKTDLGPVCSKCHDTYGWKAVKSDSFDHSRTAFPLKGLHRKTRCERCHKSGSMVGQLRFERCVECHNDIHRGEFNLEPYENRCEQCHTENGFVPSTYDIAEHRKSNYPLSGAHIAVPCISCHEKDDTSAENRFKISFEDCNLCHNDEHRGQFEILITSKGCSSCHDTRSWKVSSFDHDSTAYKLDGKHRTVSCGKCHYRISDDSPEGYVRYVGLSKSCSGCHGTDLLHSGPGVQDMEVEKSE